MAGAALAGCDQQAQPTDNRQSAEIDVLPPDESIATSTEDLAAGAVDPPGAATMTAPSPETPIPAALHGRWGLTREDCAGERDDTRGLVTISGESISFFNSVARPERVYESSADRIHGEFAFATADGRSWTGPMIWSVEGNRLVRIDSEAESRQVYSRC